MTLVHYGRINAESSLVPAVSSNTEGTCTYVVFTPHAKLLGVPNSVYGIFYYVIIVIASIVRIVTLSWPLLPLLVAFSVGAAIYSIYLAWVLIFKLKTSCPLCFTAQAVNIALAGVFLAAI